MHFEEAFSVQFGRTLTAERAYELFWAGTIDDKRAFQCPADGCAAQITCANLDVIEQDLKLQPHFRLYGEHAAGCQFGREQFVENVNAPGTGSRTRSAQGLDRPDLFQFKRPQDHFIRTNAVQPNAGNVAKGKRSANPRPVGSSDARQRNFYSVGNLVSRWLVLRKEGRLAESHVHVGNMVTTYDRLFRGIYNQDTHKLEGEVHVYWGKAWAERMPSGDAYRLRFNESLQVNGQPCRPSLLIFDDKIERYGLKKLLVSRLDAAIEQSKGACVMFILGAPVVVPGSDSTTSTGSPTRSFVNFKLPSLDMVEVRGLDLYEQLRRDR